MKDKDDNHVPVIVVGPGGRYRRRIMPHHLRRMNLGSAVEIVFLAFWIIAFSIMIFALWPDR